MENIEKFVFENINSYPKEELSLEDFKLLAQILLIPEETIFPNKDKFPLFKIIEKRLEILHNFKLSNKTIFLLAFFSNVPGYAVLYLLYLQHWYNIYEIKITAEVICHRIFPHGLPSKDNLNKLANLLKKNN